MIDHIEEDMDDFNVAAENIGSEDVKSKRNVRLQACDKILLL